MIGAITAKGAFLNDNATALQWYQQEWRRSGKAAFRLGQIFDKFTRTPFVSPHFFINEAGRWRIDMVAEVRNTAEHVGGV